MPKSRLKILMIEEDRYLRKVYKNSLTRAGFRFIDATNGVEGLDKVVYEKPDLIILDVILPIKNGYEVLRELKRNKNTRAIPVVVLSNLSKRTEIERALALGAKEYLVKTDVSLEDVLAKIIGFLGS